MFYSRFSHLCALKGVTPAAVAKELGLSNSAATYWKKGTVPKVETVQKIADYFHVSVEWLLGTEDVNRRIFLGSDVMVENDDGEIYSFDSSTYLGKIGMITHGLKDQGKSYFLHIGDILIDLDENGRNELIQYGDYLVLKKKSKNAPPQI